MGGAQRHDKPATHFELFNQWRRDMPKCGCYDYCVERTTFQPSMITVADLDAHIVIAELSHHLRSGFGQWRDKFNRKKIFPHTRHRFGPGNRTHAHSPGRMGWVV